MEEFFSTSPTVESDTQTEASYYSGDYDVGLSEGTTICVKSSVRDFQKRYEPPLYWTIFILGALGNMMVVCIYGTVRNRLKTMTDVYLLSLAVADLFFLVTMPFWATSAVKGWYFGVVLCKLVSALYKLNLYSSMFLLTCISIDRYIAIVRVTKAQNWKTKSLSYSKLVCLGVWLSAAVLALPEIIFARVKTDRYGSSACTLVYWNNDNNVVKILVLSLQICMGFCLPLLVMTVSYSIIVRTLLRAKSFEKQKALRVIFAVVLVFVLTQLPHNVLLMMETLQAANMTITECSTAKNFDIAGQVAKSVAYTHACLNPFLYVFIGVRFRQDLLRAVNMCYVGLSKRRLRRTHTPPRRPPVTSDTETTPALSIIFSQLR